MDTLKQAACCCALILLGLYSSCMPEQAPPQASFDLAMPVILDTNTHEHAEQAISYLEMARYQPLYIGVYRDSIMVSDTTGIFKYLNIEPDTVAYDQPDSSDLFLRIDTSQIISDYWWSMWTEEREFSARHSAYPIMLVNTSPDTLYIGNGDYLPILMEARDRNGQWRPIQTRTRSICVQGTQGISLPPGEIVISAVPIYRGNWTTKLRLKIHQNLSAEFVGSINETQFDERPYPF